jgi:protein-disulfide isomerase
MSANTPDEMSELRRTSAAHAQAEKGGDRLRTLLLGVAAVVLIGALLAAVIIFQGGGGGTVGPVDHPPRAAATAHGIAIGSADAPVHVVVYEDFTDSGSARFEMASRDYLHTDAAAGLVYVEYRPVALAGNDAPLAAFASVLDTAGAKPALRFHDLLFQQRATGAGPVTDDELVSLAQKAGAKGSAVQAATGSGRHQPWVAEAAAAATKAGVTRTPSVLVDGSRMAGPIDQVVDRLETRIAKED